MEHSANIIGAMFLFILFSEGISNYLSLCKIGKLLTKDRVLFEALQGKRMTFPVLRNRSLESERAQARS